METGGATDGLMPTIPRLADSALPADTRLSEGEGAHERVPIPSDARQGEG